MLRRAVGMAGKIGKAGKTQPAEQAHSPQNRHCRRTQPADSPLGSGLKTNKRPQMVGLAAKTAAAADDVGLSPCR